MGATRARAPGDIPGRIAEARLRIAATVRFADEVTIHAPRAAVWDFLLDPERVATCFPEVDRFERLGPTRARASIPTRVAFLSVRIVVDIDLVEQEAPGRAVFRIHATGPGATVDGRASFGLAEGQGADGAPETLVSWEAEIEPKGMAASIPPATIERHAEPALQRAIDCLRRSVER